MRVFWILLACFVALAAGIAAQACELNTAVSPIDVNIHVPDACVRFPVTIELGDGGFDVGLDIPDGGIPVDIQADWEY